MNADVSPSPSGATGPLPGQPSSLVAVAASAASALPLTPAQRLAATRAQLRAVMFPPPAPALPSSAGRVDHWLASLKSLPGVDIAVGAVQGWWKNHPLRPMSAVASQASKAALRPLAKDHPVGLMLLAVGAGALIASLRPWRWALRSALFAGLLPQVLARTVRKLPIESWMSILGAAMGTRAGVRAPVAPVRPVPPVPVARP